MDLGQRQTGARRQVIGLSGRESDQVALIFEGNRHLTYYVIRVFLPMLVLISVGWALFFLDEYRRRIEIAGGNLLVFVAFNWAISADLPKLGYLTFLDFILQCMFLMTGALIVFNVALRKLKVSGPRKGQPDCWTTTRSNGSTRWVTPPSSVMPFLPICWCRRCWTRFASDPNVAVMLRYALKRLISLLLSLIVASVVIFAVDRSRAGRSGLVHAWA